MSTIYLLIEIKLQVLHQKLHKTLDEITDDLCPVSPEQDKLIKNALVFPNHQMSNISKFHRFWASAKYIALEQCSGTTNMVHKVYRKR
jgi:hypothetical protein